MADEVIQILHDVCEAARAEAEVTPGSQTQATIQSAVLLSKTIEAGFAAMLAGTADDAPADDEDDAPVTASSSKSN